jgi:hypothetical protein
MIQWFRNVRCKIGWHKWQLLFEKDGYEFLYCNHWECKFCHKEEEENCIM